MSPTEVVAVLGAIAGLIVAITALLGQLRDIHVLVDGKMTQLLQESKAASQALGELRGRDFTALGRALAKEGDSAVPAQVGAPMLEVQPADVREVTNPGQADPPAA